MYLIPISITSTASRRTGRTSGAKSGNSGAKSGNSGAGNVISGGAGGGDSSDPSKRGGPSKPRRAYKEEDLDLLICKYYYFTYKTSAYLL